MSELLDKIKGLGEVPLRQKLNELGIYAETNRGKVVALAIEDHKLTSEELMALEIDPENIGYIDEHPEGADRGGHVIFVEATASEVYFDEGGCEWLN